MLIIVFLAFRASSFSSGGVSFNLYGIFNFSYFLIAILWYGRISSAFILFNSAKNLPNSDKYFSLYVISGTTTWRIHTGTLCFERYLAKSKIFSFECPVSFLCSALSMCLISSSTKSVYFINSLNLSGLSLLKVIPDVSSAVWILCNLKSLKRLITADH